jgi:hypothetical protein
MGINCAVDRRDSVGSGHEGHESGGAAAAETAAEGETGGEAREKKDKYPDPRREMPGRQELKSMGEERFPLGGSHEAPSGKLSNSPSSSVPHHPVSHLRRPRLLVVFYHSCCLPHAHTCRHHPHVKYSAPEKRSAPTEEQRTLRRRFASWQ